MQQALRLEHVDVPHLGQPGVSGHAVAEVRELVDVHLLGLDPGLGAAAGQIGRGLLPRDAAGLLVVVLVHLGIGRLQHEDDVAGLGVGRVLRTGAGHVDNALLEAHQLARRQDGRSRQHEGLALANGLDIAQDAREDLPLALDLPTGLKHVLNRNDAGLFPRHGQVDIQVLAQERILGYQVEQLLFVDGQRPVRIAGLIPELQLLDKNSVKFQLHSLSSFSS